MRKILIFFIRFYQKSISPTKASCCRFYPTCSAYAIEALETHGAFKGSFLSICRLLRCNPLCKGGYDPVPIKPKNKTEKTNPLPKYGADLDGE